LKASAGEAWKLQKGKLESFRKGSLEVRILAHGGSDSHRGVLEIGEMVISAFIGLVGLGPASLLTTTTKMSICPHMTSYSNTHHPTHHPTHHSTLGREFDSSQKLALRRCLGITY